MAVRLMLFLQARDVNSPRRVPVYPRNVTFLVPRYTFLTMLLWLRNTSNRVDVNKAWLLKARSST